MRFLARPLTPWCPFYMQETLEACYNISVLGPNYITWWYLKLILASNTYTVDILFLANVCLLLHYWPKHFKELVSVIIPKSGNLVYNTPKVFRPIVLLNTLDKLIEKIITRQLQFDTVKYGILHSNQLGDIAQWSTKDASMFMTYLV